MLTLPYFEDLLFFVPNSLFIAGFFDSENNFFKTFYSLFQIAFLLTVKIIFSTDTPATATCKEKLLIALHNSLLIVLLDIWEQNILVFDEEWVGRLLDFPTIGVVERNI
jgi:hypothetical protein